MALTYGTYSAATYLAAMDAADAAASKPVGTTRNKIINMAGMASIQANLRTWTDKLVKDIVNNLPVEQYLDQTKTTMVPNFDWATMGASYPGATDPGLDGKPVLVFAVVGKPVKSESTAPDTVVPDTDTTTYSFLSLENLIDTSAIEDRLDDLEDIVGEEADTSAGTPATGLIKKMDDVTTEIGVKAKPETSLGAGDAVAASGLYKYIDDAVAGIQSELEYATVSDIAAIFD